MKARIYSAGFARLAVVLVAAVSLVAVSQGVPVHAADVAAETRDSIVLSPSSQHLTLKAGSVTTGKLTIINDGTVEENFIVYGRPYSVRNEQYDPDFQTMATNTDIYQWVQFDKTAYSLAAGKSLEVPYRIQVPAKAAPGGHYGVIFVETQPPAGATDSVMRKKRIGSLLQATIEGTGIQKGRFVSSAAAFWQTTPPLAVSSRVENTGNTDFQAATVLTVKDLFGTVKYQSTQDLTVYPGTTRKITLSWDKAPWFGLFKVDQSVTVLGQTTAVSHFVLMAPRWLPIILIIIVIAWVAYGIAGRKRR